MVDGAYLARLRALKEVLRLVRALRRDLRPSEGGVLAIMGIGRWSLPLTLPVTGSRLTEIEATALRVSQGRSLPNAVMGCHDW
ncbi:hypothetical protein NDU88_008078 [Pleurodeles waltl]|uniref:Uncharacterized protein n=1 Tax=Pleurodeles waltl TaxID=8319 RepID=A0AAV7PQU6_PLEWA|nr:hypothetical protein NDU88_008078 [Pleurodeles waltl]